MALDFPVMRFLELLVQRKGIRAYGLSVKAWEISLDFGLVVIVDRINSPYSCKEEESLGSPSARSRL